MQGNQDKHGYAIVFPEFEYAKIDGDYYRYSAGVGYVFNQRWRNIELTPTVSWGFIDRYDKTVWSFSGTLELSYKINDYLKVSAISQLTQRTDLLLFYGENVIRYSGFIGLEYNLF